MQRRDISEIGVPVPQVIAWVLGVGGFFAGAIAFVAWGWISNRLSNLEQGITTPMAVETRAAIKRIDKDIERLEKAVEECRGIRE